MSRSARQMRGNGRPGLWRAVVAASRATTQEDRGPVPCEAMDEIRWFQRLGVSARPAVTALLTGVVGTVALGKSFIVEWQHLVVSFGVSMDTGFTITREEPQTQGLAQLPYANAYVIGALVLLTMLAAAAAQPHRSRWLRFATAGLGIGLAALVTVMIYNVQLPVDMARRGFFVTTQHPEAGGYWALGAIGVLVAGVWLTAGPTPHGTSTPGGQTGGQPLRAAASPTTI